MRCTKCGTDNRGSAKFCDKCGARLSPKCPACGVENRPDAKFCDSCGANLGAAEADSITKSNDARIRIGDQPTGENLEGERKTVTMLFADIKGSMDLIEDLDPEEARAIVDPALKLMMEAVQRYGGYVAQSTGDGIFALFGAPVAHEDHPQRALHAALAMQQAIRDYAAKHIVQDRPAIEARVGVGTGEMVVRTIEVGGHTEYTPVGLTANLAARLQTVAPPGSVAVSETIRRLCDGYFTFRGLGPTTVKGVSEPVEVYEVTGAGALRAHFQLAAERGLTRFVGCLSGAVTG